MPAGGRGYTRPPSLISVWSTAPFLLNNSDGHFESSPSVDARMRSFNDSIHQMLWPETRAKDSDQSQSLPAGTYLLSSPGPNLIDRTNQRSYLRIATGYLPGLLGKIPKTERKLLPWLFDENGVRFGPFPAGIPVDLLAISICSATATAGVPG